MMMMLCFCVCVCCERCPLAIYFETRPKKKKIITAGVTIGDWNVDDRCPALKKNVVPASMMMMMMGPRQKKRITTTLKIYKSDKKLIDILFVI